jgi:hypothetical protein
MGPLVVLLPFSGEFADSEENEGSWRREWLSSTSTTISDCDDVSNMEDDDNEDDDNKLDAEAAAEGEKSSSKGRTNGRTGVLVRKGPLLPPFWRSGGGRGFGT